MLYADPDNKFNQVGVTVTPVRIDSLARFGTLDDVSERLVKSEKAKVRRAWGQDTTTVCTTYSGYSSIRVALLVCMTL